MGLYTWFTVTTTAWRYVPCILLVSDLFMDGCRPVAKSHVANIEGNKQW